MYKRIALLLGGGLTATSLSLGANAVLATSAQTWTVSPGGIVKATGTGTSGSLQDGSTGTTLTCTSTAGQGTVKSGSGLAGQNIGMFTSITFSGCTGPAGLTFTVKTSASKAKAADQSAKSYNASTGVTKETITHISATITGPSCSATVNGTSPTGNNGMVAGSYSNKTQISTISSSGGNLHIYNVQGCLGLINNGDPAVFTSSYKVSPGLIITSP